MLVSLPVAFAAILSILIVGFLPIVDPDFFWHLSTGELIRASGEVPTVDVFSHTANGRPWAVQGWLSDVVLAGVWNSAGVFGIRALVAILVVLTWVVVYRCVRLYLARIETAVLLSGVSVALMAPAVVPRPTLATSLGLALTLYCLLGFRRTGRVRWLLALPPIFAVWVNLHFGFVTGLGLAGLFVVSDLLARAVPLQFEYREKGSSLRAGPLSIGILCVLAIGINPHGYGVFAEVIGMIAVNSASPIGEWQSPSFGSAIGKLVYGAICIYVVARAFAPRSIHWIDLVVPLAVIGAALSAQRHVSLMGIALVPFVARALADWSSVTAAKPARRDAPASVRAAKRELSTRAASLVNLALVLVVAVGTLVAAPFAERHFAIRQRVLQPEGAADFVLRHDLEGRIFNTYNGGGYLINRLFPRQFVFIDGRYNPYPKELIDDYFTIVNGKPDWFVTLERYQIDIVLSETDAHFRQSMLQRKEFRLVYEDREFSVLVRDIERFRALPSVEPSLDRAVPD